MPSIYAHYRFGAQLIATMTPQMQRTVGRFRQLYDLGLHGPDIFRYAGLTAPGAAKLGKKLHNQTGKVFFEHMCRNLRLSPSEGARAYLYGVLAHYALDSLSHPFINRMAPQRSASHMAIETEFDRYLLERDGKKPPHMQDLSGHIRLTPGECRTVAQMYSNVRVGTVSSCVQNMAALTRSRVMQQSGRRQVIEKAVRVLAPDRMPRLMTVHPDRTCSELDPSLLRLYELAADRYPVLVEQIRAHLRHNEPLGTDFSVPFDCE
jgi:hypothetical protein